MPQRSQAVTGGRISVTVPVSPAGLVRAQGWLNWRTGTIYLAVRNPDNAAQNGLVRADRYGVSTWETRTGMDQPPLKPPRGGWRSTSWWDRARGGPTDLDILLRVAVSLTEEYTAYPVQAFLRRDSLAGVPVAVFEMRVPGHRLRCWVEDSGVLRRLEVRTRVGAYASLDITPGPVPQLPAAR
jgi:hypothetical protein